MSRFLHTTLKTALQFATNLPLGPPPPSHHARLSPIACTLPQPRTQLRTLTPPLSCAYALDACLHAHPPTHTDAHPCMPMCTYARTHGITLSVQHTRKQARACTDTRALAHAQGHTCIHTHMPAPVPVQPGPPEVATLLAHLMH